MQWLYISLVVCAWATLGTSEPDLRCSHPLCVDDGYDNNTLMHTFTVEASSATTRLVLSNNADVKSTALIFSTDLQLRMEQVIGHKITYKYGHKGILFDMHCGKWQALDSPAIPSLSSCVSKKYIMLSACPLPSTRSLADALAAINITVQNAGEITLDLIDLPADPQLTERHFEGFENIVKLWISAISPKVPTATPDFNFLTKLPNLRSLNLDGISIPANVDLPPTLHGLTVSRTTVRPLIEMLRQASNLRTLALRFNEIVTSDAVPNDTSAQETKPSALEELSLVKWKEQRLTPFDRCDNLKALWLLATMVAELPNGWIAACPRLRVIEIRGAPYLLSLPPKLLAGASALKSFTIHGVLQTLPEGLFEEAPNLIQLDVSSNKLKSLSSTMFAGLTLQILRVESIELDNLEVIATLTSLKVLSIDDNPLGDLCDRNGYSVLKNLNQLEELSLQMLNITHTCKDWVENMSFLRELHLERTNITESDITDLIFTRDASVKNVTVYLDDPLDNYSIKTITFPNDDQKKADASP